jgi:hypothetical protein
MCEISTSLTSWQEESNTVHNKSTLNELYPTPQKKPLCISEPCLTNFFCDVGMQTETSHTKNVSFPATIMLLYLSLELYFFFIASKSKHSQTLQWWDIQIEHSTIVSLLACAINFLCDLTNAGTKA